jgi:hypothetical protein
LYVLPAQPVAEPPPSPVEAVAASPPPFVAPLPLPDELLLDAPPPAEVALAVLFEPPVSVDPEPEAAITELSLDELAPGRVAAELAVLEELAAVCESPDVHPGQTSKSHEPAAPSAIARAASAGTRRKKGVARKFTCMTKAPARVEQWLCSPVAPATCFGSPAPRPSPCAQW